MSDEIDGEEDLVFNEEDLPKNPDDLESGDLVPEGIHDVACVSLKKKDGDADKVPQLSTRWKVEGGVADGQSLFHNITLPSMGEKSGTRRARQLMLKRLGVINEEDFKSGGARVDYGLLKGLEATVEVVHREYKKKMYANIDFGGWHERGWTPEEKTDEAGAKKAVDNFDEI